MINGITFILSVDLAMFCFIFVCVATGPRSDAEGLVAGLMNWAQSFGSLKWETGNKAFRQCSTLADFRQAF